MLIALIIETLIIVWLVFELIRKSKQAGQSYVNFRIEEAKNVTLRAQNDDLLEDIYKLQEKLKKISSETNKKTVKTTKKRTTKKKEEEK